MQPELEKLAKKVGQTVAVPLAIAGILGGVRTAVGAEDQTDTGATDSATEQHIQELKDSGAMKYKLVVPGLSKAEVPPTPTPTPVRPTPTPENRSQIEGLSIEGSNLVATLINQERQKAGLPTLSVNKDLEDAAQKYARLVMSTVDFKNLDPNTIHDLDGSAKDRANREGYPGYVNENLGIRVVWGDTSEWGNGIINGWMDSPGHKDNMLGKIWTSMGVGCITDKIPETRLISSGRPDVMVPYVVCIADFGTTVRGNPPPPPPPGR